MVQVALFAILPAKLAMAPRLQIASLVTQMGLSRLRMAHALIMMFHVIRVAKRVMALGRRTAPPVSQANF